MKRTSMWWWLVVGSLTLLWLAGMFVMRDQLWIPWIALVLAIAAATVLVY